MRYCAFILLASLPTIWVVVGCLLILVTVISVALYALKSCEVFVLKKEVMELRDTMRMMRYEEANLARMLHTADKAEPLKSQEEQKDTEVLDSLAASMADDVQVENMAFVPEEFVESTSAIAEVAVAEEQIEAPVADESIAEEVIEAEDTFEEDTLADDAEETAVEVETDEAVDASEGGVAADEEAAEELVQEQEDTVLAEQETVAIFESQEEVLEVEVAIPSTPTRKQAINERRPAIPTDLFAAWFEENESQAEEPKVSPAIESLQPEERRIAAAESIAPIEEHHAIAAEVLVPGSSVEVPEVQAQEEEEESNAPAGQSKEDERFCRKLERLVHTRMRNPNLNIDIIASQFGMGRTNFYKKVRELMGMSPNDYLRKCRMERAAELLRTSDQPITEVCAQVGIPDAQYFSRVFKTFYGTTPSAYREQ